MANAATPRAVEAVPEDARDPLIGRVLEGRYRIDDLLGEGGIGRVYRAMHLKLDRPVALKVLHEGFRNSADVRQRFEREAKTLSALRHPNVVTITDYGVEDDLPFLVMELVEGRDLDQLLESREELLPIGRVLGLMAQVLRSLAQAHGMGIIHRDLKPGNALLQVLPDGSDHVEVLDFGLAKFVDDAPAAVSSPKLTRAGTVVGTPAYMAPEQASRGTCDARTDVYAAGVMLFELLTGELPFPMQDPAAMLRAHLVQTPPKLRS
ncbi:MAG: serine/threonine protein kinase, partial [Sandaracinus sp.]|nr:serine/threonine protein kinase [Sandaracinus sp.]